MKKLQAFAHRDRPFALLLKERLAGEGIACLLRNDELSAALGELPFVEIFPELWVVDDEVLPRARLLLAQWLEEGGSARGEPWQCQQCGESHEAQFDACWQCGAERR